MVSGEDEHEDSSTLTMNESLTLPAPTDQPDDSSSSEASTEDEDYNATAAEEDLSGVYKNWLDELDREDLHMMAMVMYDNYLKRFGLLKTSAAKEVALCLGVGEKSVRMWKKSF